MNAVRDEQTDYALFHRALNFVLDFEAGYVNDPDDSGGPTNFGITQKTYNAYRSRKNLSQHDVRAISSEEVIEIYWISYWHEAKCNLVPAALAFSLFNASVNCGPERAIKILQEAIGTSVDGDFGPKTYAKAQDGDTQRFYQVLCDFYATISTGKYAKNAKFLAGWLRRARSTYRESEKAAILFPSAPAASSDLTTPGA